VDKLVAYGKKKSFTRRKSFLLSFVEIPDLDASGDAAAFGEFFLWFVCSAK